MVKRKKVVSGWGHIKNEHFLKETLLVGNKKDNSFHSETVLRDRIGHNMKKFLSAYVLGIGRKAHPAILKRQWHALRGAGSEALDILDSVQRRRAFLLLEKQGYVYRMESNVNGKKTLSFQFTEKGLDLQQRFSDEAKLERLSKEASSSKTKDSKMHVISWDIPEALRRKRALFRHFVRGLGFRLLHKSLFVGDINVTKFFSEAARLLGVEKYIHCGIYQSTVYAGVAVV